MALWTPNNNHDRKLSGCKRDVNNAISCMDLGSAKSRNVGNAFIHNN